MPSAASHFTATPDEPFNSNVIRPQKDATEARAPAWGYEKIINNNNSEKRSNQTKCINVTGNIPINRSEMWNRKFARLDLPNKSNQMWNGLFPTLDLTFIILPQTVVNNVPLWPRPVVVVEAVSACDWCVLNAWPRAAADHQVQSLCQMSSFVFNVLEQFRNAPTLLKFVSHINSIRPVCHSL